MEIKKSADQRTTTAPPPETSSNDQTTTGPPPETPSDHQTTTESTEGTTTGTTASPAFHQQPPHARQATKKRDLQRSECKEVLELSTEPHSFDFSNCHSLSESPSSMPPSERKDLNQICKPVPIASSDNHRICSGRFLLQH
ncbi:hypothetical protein LXL04_012283 [Taraxacum kok-saghyz]